MKREQRGIHLVEFAITGSLFLLVMFSVLEFGRWLWVWNTLSEGTRRGVRLAAVSCPGTGIASIKNVTLGKRADGTGAAPLPDLTLNNVCVQYTDAAGGTACTVPPTQVSVSIINYRINLAIPIPGFNRTRSAPSFISTLPVESLGAEVSGCTAVCGSACP